LVYSCDQALAASEHKYLGQGHIHFVPLFEFHLTIHIVNLVDTVVVGCCKHDMDLVSFLVVLVLSLNFLLN
jgi:hypothetical protein